MKALVFNGPRQIRYESFDDPAINDERNLIIKVESCSICGSDLHMYHGDSLVHLDYSQSMPRFCTGHETIGEVVEVGRSVNNHRVGDRILVAGATGCGKCRSCLSGHINLCEHYRTGGQAITPYGISPLLNGGHADYLEVVNADIGAAAIPEGVTDEQALLLTDALVTGYYGVKMSGVQPGSTVVVIGQGPVGRMAAEAALAVGASTVYAVDPEPTRRNAATAFGAIPLSPEEALSRVFQDTNGLGADAVIEAVGVGATLSQAVELARVGGRLSILGILQADTAFPVQIAQAKSLQIHIGIAGVADSWSELIPLVQAGRIKGEGIFTHEFELAQGEEAFRLFDSRAEGVMKVLLRP
jgi:alcohol dehydrogenase